MKTHKEFPSNLKYYKVIGLNKYIPITYYTKATGSKIAIIHFYLETDGTHHSHVLKITKKEYQENKK